MGDYGSFKRYTDKASLPVLQQHSLYLSLVTAMAHRLQANILAVGRTQLIRGHTYADSVSPGQRRIVLVKLIDGRQRLCHVRCLRLASVPRSLQKTLEREGGAYEGQEQLRVLKLFRRKYVYHPSQQTFKPLDAMPAHLPRQIFAAMEALRAINLAGVKMLFSQERMEALRAINLAGVRLMVPAGQNA
ncbi:TPA: hypothetical protein ACH3X1_013623 [Trebouxia sp. C0004]